MYHYLSLKCRLIAFHDIIAILYHPDLGKDIPAHISQDCPYHAALIPEPWSLNHSQKNDFSRNNFYFSGAFSEVKLAEHRETKKLVAIKCIPVRITILCMHDACTFYVQSLLSSFWSQFIFDHVDGDGCLLTLRHFPNLTSELSFNLIG